MKPITHSLFGMLLAAGVALGSPALAQPTVSVSPSDYSLLVGQTFSVHVDTYGMADLYAYSLSMTYDPARVQFVSVSEGAFLRGAGNTFFIPGVDNGAGRVEYSGAALLGAPQGADGLGTLLEFIFRATGAGPATFGLADVRFLDESLNDIVVMAEAAEVDVFQVPEPSGIALALVASLALLLTRAGLLARIKKAARSGAA